MTACARFLRCLSALLLLLGCQVEQPSAGAGKEQPIFLHASFVKTACTECHEQDRPAPYLKTTHGGGRNCEDCHNAKDDKSGWLPRRDFDHIPAPTGCLDCHIKERPSKKEDPNHPTTGDCVGCHDYGKIWKPR